MLPEKFGDVGRLERNRQDVGDHFIRQNRNADRQDVPADGSTCEQVRHIGLLCLDHLLIGVSRRAPRQAHAPRHMRVDHLLTCEVADHNLVIGPRQSSYDLGRALLKSLVISGSKGSRAGERLSGGLQAGELLIDISDHLLRSRLGPLLVLLLLCPSELPHGDRCQSQNGHQQRCTECHQVLAERILTLRCHCISLIGKGQAGTQR